MDKQLLPCLIQQFWVGGASLSMLLTLLDILTTTLPFSLKSRVLPRYSWTTPHGTLRVVSCPNSFSIMSINSSSTSSSSWETFKSSTCQAMVSCLLFTFLFTTQLSYLFGTKPQSFTSFAGSFSQNNQAAHRVPCKAFNNSTYMTFSPFSSVM